MLKKVNTKKTFQTPRDVKNRAVSPVEGCIATALMILHSMNITSALWVKNTQQQHISDNSQHRDGSGRRAGGY